MKLKLDFDILLPPCLRGGRCLCGTRLVLAAANDAAAV
jgi:hypothetical protein